MRSFVSLSKAMALGLLRDRAAVFFMLVFPLMFLALFGALFNNDATPQAKVVQVGDVRVLDDMPDAERATLRDVLKIEKTDGSAEARSEALKKVRKGDMDAVVFQRGKGGVELRYSAADSVRSGNVRGVVDSIVQQANQRATGQPPAYRLAPRQLEDESVKPIQYLTPGLLSWAVAMGGVFGSALNLVSWRKKRILRRLWLAPVNAASVVGARVGVNLVLAFAQTAVFVGLATLPVYGLRLTGHWWLCLPLVACGTLAFMSIGLLIGSWARTEEAANGLAQIIVLPMAFLSGSFFPLDSRPTGSAPSRTSCRSRTSRRRCSPCSARGESWGAVLPVMGGLLLFAGVLTLIAARLFRWDDA